ncbi:hypothetical protein scyTo_0019160 [Scyliorhinus torazame]|uniref:Uncharacterized protein n=1 Tax=Scyliorhinus torazame TaxID=75743 RepID=A0A401PTV4_SCYTO|nr:hypothetical protein [Scyliorhinus torazame]
MSHSGRARFTAVSHSGRARFTAVSHSGRARFTAVRRRREVFGIFLRVSNPAASGPEEPRNREPSAGAARGGGGSSDNRKFHPAADCRRWRNS